MASMRPGVQTTATTLHGQICENRPFLAFGGPELGPKPKIHPGSDFYQKLKANICDTALVLGLKLKQELGYSHSKICGKKPFLGAFERAKICKSRQRPQNPKIPPNTPQTPHSHQYQVVWVPRWSNLEISRKELLVA